MSPRVLVVFLKAPRLGTVKTRLARSLGDAAALAAYREMTGLVLDRVAEFPSIELRFSPDDSGREVEPWRRPSWTCAPQGGGDLGERLRAAFADHFSRAVAAVAVIGSDCPEVRRADIDEAFTRLKDLDVVLGPAVDGGYWLIALREPHPELFEGIPWSTPQVLSETVARAAARGLKVGFLRPLADIDTEEDWRRFLEQNNW